MKVNIEKIKNWAQKHKKGIIVSTVGGLATVTGVLVFRDKYYIVNRKDDMFTIAKDSTFLEVPEAIGALGYVDVMWRNSEHTSAAISNVQVTKLGEVGKAIQDVCNIGEDAHVGILITKNN